MPDKTLHENEWLSLKLRDDWYVFAHESRSDGIVVAVLPFTVQRYGLGMLYCVRLEHCPPWGEGFSRCAVTGTPEGADDTPLLAASRELQELDLKMDEEAATLEGADRDVALEAKRLANRMLKLANACADQIPTAGASAAQLLEAIKICIQRAEEADHLGDKATARGELGARPVLMPITRARLDSWLKLLLSNNDDDTQRLHDEIVAVLG